MLSKEEKQKLVEKALVSITFIFRDTWYEADWLKNEKFRDLVIRAYQAGSRDFADSLII